MDYIYYIYIGLFKLDLGTVSLSFNKIKGNYYLIYIQQ